MVIKIIILQILFNASLILAQEYDWQSNHIRVGECIMLTEQWKPIKNYEGIYEISNFGRVKSLERKIWNGFGFMSVKERMLKQALNKSNYYYIGLSKHNKRSCRSVHTIVWDHFGDKSRNGSKLQVDHVDENPHNNRIDNLQLLTNRENVTKGILHNAKNLPIGVRFNHNRYEAYIKKGMARKQTYLGRYKTIIEASNAYQNALERL
jgi:hypothetical protein